MDIDIKLKNDRAKCYHWLASGCGIMIHFSFFLHTFLLSPLCDKHVSLFPSGKNYDMLHGVAISWKNDDSMPLQS